MLAVPEATTQSICNTDILLGSHAGPWCTTLSCSCLCLAGAAELRGDLERATGVELPATLAFDYPTPADAAAMLAVRMANAVAHAADTSIVEDLEPTAQSLALQQAFPETGVSGNINKSLPSVPLCGYLRSRRSCLTGQAPLCAQLKTVYADEHKLAAPERTYHRTTRQTYCNPRAPTLTKPGYFTRPSLKRLQCMRSTQLKARCLPCCGLL